jgi:hypothetical protein
VSLIRFDKASLFIDDKKVGDFESCDFDIAEDSVSSESEIETTGGSFTLESTATVDRALLDSFLAAFRESRKMTKRRKRFARMRRQGKIVSPFFCGLCASLGRTKPFLSQYGLRMHLAQGNHGTSTSRHAMNVSWGER